MKKAVLSFLFVCCLSSIYSQIDDKTNCRVCPVSERTRKVDSELRDCMEFTVCNPRSDVKLIGIEVGYSPFSKFLDTNKILARIKVTLTRYQTKKVRYVFPNYPSMSEDEKNSVIAKKIFFSDGSSEEINIICSGRSR